MAMIEVRQTAEFREWLHHLKDLNALVRIIARVRRMEQGNTGDLRGVGAEVMEMRIDFGPGYRVYYKIIEPKVVLLLCGGDKRTQRQDIRRALELAKDL